MNNVIGIVSYGIVGNIHSIKKAIEKAGGEVLIIEEVNDFKKVNKIVLPGVGSFKDAMDELDSKGFIQQLNNTKKPLLGVCLGMQILSSIGFEYGKTNGLSLIDAEVIPIKVDAKIPHMGFNVIDIVKNNQLLNGLENEQFYFMHSFEVVNFHNVSSTTKYANHIFISSIKNNNIYGVQFHPEKSRDAGIQLFKNFINLKVEKYD